MLNRQGWLIGLNFLALLPNTTLTVLTIAVAFLRFYDERDFPVLQLIAQPRVWSNRLTVAALLVAVVNFCVEWDRRNRETSRLRRTEARAEDERAARLQRRVEEEQRRVEEEQRRVEEEQRRNGDREQATRRARIETERDIALLSFLANPSDNNQQRLARVLAVLNEYRDTLA